MAGWKRKVILVVDDEQGIVRMLNKYLRRLGYKVLGAYNGKQGFKLAKRKRPDMIILDIMMPRMDGYQMLEEIKEHKKTIHIPVIMLSAKKEEKDKIKASHLYCEAYITKPFKLDELGEKIEVVFNRQLPYKK